jgi:hypothetical protein
MYPLEHVYSLEAYESWRRREGDPRGDSDLRESRQSAREISRGRFWEVASWNELRAAVSFLTLTHHQDAYLVSRFPEPPGAAHPGDPSWDDWQSKTDLMRRVVAKFQLQLEGGRLLGAPRVEFSFLIPSFDEDVFGARLREALCPIVEGYADKLA